MKTIVFLIFFLLTMKATSQESTKSNWFLSFNSSIQQHDKRLFDLPGRQNLLDSQREFFGIYQWGLGILKETALKNNVKLYYGLQLSAELNTFRRPFDHRFRVSSTHDAGRYTDRSFNFIFSTPIKWHFYNNPKFGFLIELLPQMSVYTIAANSQYTYPEGPYNWLRLDFYSFEFNPGIHYTIQNSKLEIKYRAAQIKRVDPILFYDNLRTGIKDLLEIYNPFKGWISWNYRI